MVNMQSIVRNLVHAATYVSDIDPCNSLENIKRKLATKESLPPNEIPILFPISPSLPTKEIPSKTIPAQVRTLTGRTITINIDPENDAISDIKEKIAAVEGIPPDQQRIIYIRQTSDSMTLKELHVENNPNPIFHLVLRIRG